MTRMTRVLGVLNGTVGDYLDRTSNALATPMEIVRRGEPTPTPVVLIHGLMGSERDWHARGGEDYGVMLARTLGWSPIYVRYNSGRAIADNGADLAALLDTLIASWPVEI